MEAVVRLLAGAACGRRHGQGQVVLAQRHQAVIAHIPRVGVFHGRGGTGRCRSVVHLDLQRSPALGREGPDAVFVINRGVRAAVQHLAVIAGEFVVGLCLFKVRVAQQDIALQGRAGVHIAGAQLQRRQTVGAGRRRCPYGIPARFAVLRRHREGHGAAGEVQHAAAGRYDGCSVGDGGVDRHVGQFASGGEHVVKAAVAVRPRLLAVQRQLFQLTVPVFQFAEPGEYRQAAALAAALLPGHAPQYGVGVVVQRIHKGGGLHVLQLHGRGGVAHISVAHGGQQADVLIVQAACVKLINRGMLFRLADQVARHRLGLLRAVLHGTGVIAVVHVELVYKVAAASCAPNAAHDGLFHLDGAQVEAVLHPAPQLAHDAAGHLAGGDGAVVGAAHNVAVGRSPCGVAHAGISQRSS